MTASPSQINAGRTLAAVLAEQRTLSAAPALALVRSLARQIGELHTLGMIHGAIAPAAVLLDDLESPRLETPAPGTVLGLDGDWSGLIPELSRLPPLKLPITIENLRLQLQGAGSTVDPRQIDLCQLGALVCRLLTGDSAGAYLRSPRVKGLVPGELRSLLERLLGANGRERVADTGELLAELDAVAGRLAESEGGVQTGHDSQAAGPVPPDSSKRSSGDTTPSFVSSSNQVADTTVVVPAIEASGESASGKAAPVGSASEAATAIGRDSQAVLPFARLGHYEIIDRLGQGGMGEVYLGYERALDRKVAVKVLPADLARSSDFVRRFKAEASAAARLIHPHVVQIFVIGEDSGHHYFAMQYVEGESLAGLLHRRKKLEVDETLSLTEQVLSGLGAAHKLGLVHRDIKPGNILLDREQGRALLGDFGLVKLLEGSASGHTATGVIMGTVDYISPEQGRGQAVDGRSDLYSMGVLVYQLLSGRLPFEADNPTALIFQHVYEQPPSLTGLAPHVPASLAAVVEKLLAKSPADRYQDVDELRADLQAVRSGTALPSGADRPRAAAQPRERASTIIHAPRQDDEVELPVGLLGDLQPLDWFQAAQGRALSLFRRHAPEVIQQLQNTQQQIDGAVAEYARRERKLAQLVQEAEGVLGELVSQAAAQRTAAREAQARGRQAVGSDEGHAEQVDELACAQAASELERQAAEQEEQLGLLRLRLAQSSARLQELRNQRDILQARFKAAGVQKLVAGGVRARRPVVTAKAMIAILLAVVLAAAVSLYRDGQPQIVDDASTGSIDRPIAAGSDTGAATSPPVSTKMKRDVPLELTGLPLHQFDTTKQELLALGFDKNGQRVFGVPAYGPLAAFYIPSWSRTGGGPTWLKGMTGTETLAVVACSLDGRYLATATVATKKADQVIQVWNSDSGQQVKKLAVMANPVRSLAFRPDGAVLATVTTDASGQGTVDFWNVLPGESGGHAQVKNIDARSVVFAPRGDRLAIAGNDRQISLWDVPSAKTVHKLDAMANPITGMTFCPGRNVLIAGDEAGAVAMWDTSSGQRLGRFDRHDLAISALVASPNGKWLATADAAEICVWDVRLGSLRRIFAQAGATALAFSPDNSVLVSCGKTSPLTVWSADVDPPPIIHPMQTSGSSLTKHDVPTVSTRIMPLDDDNVLFGAGQQLHRFDRGLGTVVQRYSGHQGKVRGLTISRDAGLIFSGAEDGTVRVWNAKSAETVASLDVRIDPQQPFEPVLSLAASAHGESLLIGTDRSVFVWQRLPVSRLERIDASPGWLAVAWSPDGQRALASGFSASDGQGVLRILDIATRRELNRIDGRPAIVSDALFIGGGSQLLYVDGSSAHLCWTDSAHEVRGISLPEAKPATMIGQSADGKYLSIGLGAAVSIRDAHSGDELLRSAGIYEKDQVLQSAFTPSGRYVVSLRAGNKLKWHSVFPCRALKSIFSSPFSENGLGNVWYDSLSKDRELIWRRLELDRPAALQFQGPAEVPGLADFTPDGGWGINDGLLVRDPGATHAAIDLGQIREAEMNFKVNLHKTNIFFLLVGWNGKDGHLLCKAPHDAGGDWSLYSSRDGSFRSSTRVRLGQATTSDPTMVKVLLRGTRVKLEVASQPVGDWQTLPDYSPGHVVLGVVDGRNPDAPVKVDSIEIKP